MERSRPMKTKITQNEEQLIEQLLIGGPAEAGAAFEELVRRHGPMVRRVCRRILHHQQDAEDAFQTTFLSLFRKAATIQERRFLGTWLYRVATRHAVHVRTRAARHRLE